MRRPLSLAVALFAAVPAFTAGAQLPVTRKPLDAVGIKRRQAGINEYKSSKAVHIRPLDWNIDEYFCRRTSGMPREDATSELDEQGLPKKRHPSGSFFHPITLARFVINYSITYMNTGDPVMYVWTETAADKLISLMRADGAFTYPHPYNLYYYGKLPSGWTSAMAQGTVLSAFARAYHVTCDKRYLEAGEKTLAYLLTPIEKGGTTTSLRYLHPSLAGDPWYEEYPNPNKPAYTLNGFMYTLLGIHDWAEATGSEKAKNAFDAGVRSLVKILPLYDYDGFSIYDLAPIVYGTTPLFNPHYHRVHLMQLSALHAITAQPIFEEYRAKWYASVGGKIVPCGERSPTAVPLDDD
jgi:hypothetical protein